MKSLKPTNSETYLEKNKQEASHLILKYTVRYIYSTVTVIKTVWHRQKDRHTDHTNNPTHVESTHL